VHVGYPSVLCQHSQYKHGTKGSFICRTCNLLRGHIPDVPVKLVFGSRKIHLYTLGNGEDLGELSRTISVLNVGLAYNSKYDEYIVRTKPLVEH
jgi:hypothetical protein